jgi:hydroxymethylpyrimidine pyrophosphatase-like HAD family hydrolase
MRSGTIFLDIDGTILAHKGSLTALMIESPQILPGVLEKLNEWEARGFNIILTTGRTESQRRFTENQLESLGIFYDFLLMGIGGGPRYLINDRKPNKAGQTAFAFNVDRDTGLNDIIF